MAILKLIQFSGEIPRVIPRLLPESAAQRAENVRLDDGGLTPVRKAQIVHTVTELVEGEIRTIYKHNNDWLVWDTEVNAAPGPVAQDRLYYTGDGVPKMRVDGDVYNLAVPFPAAALTATLVGSGSGAITERLYVYTYVTEFGEESEPCPISNAVNWQAGKTVTLSGFSSAPSGRGITLQRIYRSQSSIANGNDLFFIAERSANSSDYSDAIAVDDFGEVVPSRTWNTPPNNLSGLISLPNGMMAGFVGKDLYFSEPFHPHAWPEIYVLTMDYAIVALGAYATTIVVMTDGQPYIVQGQSPENMVQERIEKNLPCVNARGVVDLGYGIAYPSKAGLVLASQSGIDVATKSLMTRDDWLRTSPATYVAGQFDGRYFASYEFLEDDGTSARGTYIFDLTGETPFMLRASRYAEACFYDVTETALYMLSGTGIYEWDSLVQVNEIMTWKSKQFVNPGPVSYGCILIEGTADLTPIEQAVVSADNAAILARNAALFAQASIYGEFNGSEMNYFAINGDALTPIVDDAAIAAAANEVLYALISIGGDMNGAAMNVYPVNGDALARLFSDKFISVRVYADGNLVATVSDMNEVVRLPTPMYGRAKLWEVEVNGTAEVSQISLATTPRELNTF